VTADVAIVAATVAVVQALCDERWVGSEEQRALPEAALANSLRDAIRDGGAALFDDPAYLRCFGMGPGARSAHEIWSTLIEDLNPDADGSRAALDVILREGTLAERLLRSIGGDGRPEHLLGTYRELGGCLRRNALFLP